MEDKKKIIEAFGEVMKMTRNYSDMVSLEYGEGKRRRVRCGHF